MLLPVCYQCALEMKCVRNGFSVAQKGGGTTFFGDRYECPNCGHGVVVNFGSEGMPKEETIPELIIS